MGQPLLHKSFFKENPLDKISSALIADFSLTVQYTDELNAEIERIVGEHISDERHLQIARDKDEVEKINSGEAVIAYMRKNHDGLVDPMFCKKALTLEAEAAPLIIRRYKTTGQDRFVELAFRILAKADQQYAQQLFTEYREIRNPYAQSMACLLFGEQKMEEAVPLLMKEYERFKKEFPEESFNQAPLLALYILYGEAWTL